MGVYFRFDYGDMPVPEGHATFKSNENDPLESEDVPKINLEGNPVAGVILDSDVNKKPELEIGRVSIISVYSIDKIEQK